MLLDATLRPIIRRGTLRIVNAAGKTSVYEGEPGLSSTIRLTDKRCEWDLFLRPELKLGENYMDGRLVVEEGDLYNLLDLLMSNIALEGYPTPQNILYRLRVPFRRLKHFNSAGRAKRNARHHYDLFRSLYELFLDEDMQYTCAYFQGADDTLEEAQRAKKDHVIRKLLLEPGMRVVELGCGWGGLALDIGRLGGDVTAVNISKEQVAVARQRAGAAGLNDRVRFELADYRDAQGVYDRVVSVGILEHIGINHYPTFFRKVRDLLTDDGVAVIHSIGRAFGPSISNPWIDRYIFPGGHTPALSEIIPVVEGLNLWITDIEILRLHYAETLRHWRERFLANRDRAEEIYDARFCRMWEFYLASMELLFRRLDGMVFHLQIAKRRDAAPLTRNYLYDDIGFAGAAAAE